MIVVERACLGAFFDLHLRHHHDDDRLLGRSSRRYPEIEFVP